MPSCPMPDLTPMATVEAKSVLPKGWKADLSQPKTLDLTLPVTELIRRTTSRMPQDIIEALVASRNGEAEGSRAANTLDTMLENIQLADDHVAPLCQDTGTVIFWVRHPFGVSQRLVQGADPGRGARVHRAAPGCAPTASSRSAAGTRATTWTPSAKATR